jgi:hypothetical protein
MSQPNDVVTTFQRYAVHAANTYKHSTTTEEDTHECAEFLLTLKHRSVAPECHDLTYIKDGLHDLTYRSFQALSHKENRDPSMKGKISNAITNPIELCDQGTMGISWESLIEGSQLVSMSDRELVPDALFVSMAQMKPCVLTESDRVGCYKSRPEAFAGLCCRHCGGPFIRQAVLELQRQQTLKESGSSSRPRYGSRKIFFQRIWGRLHKPHSESNHIEDYTPDQTPEHSDVEDEGSDMHSADLISSSNQLILFHGKIPINRKAVDPPMVIRDNRTKRVKLELIAN